MSARTAITNATITGVEARPEDECFADVDRPLFPKATAEQWARTRQPKAGRPKLQTTTS